MCLIVDADAAGRFLARPSPLRNWLLGQKGNPRLVAAGALMKELVQLDAVRRLLRELNRAGRLRPADAGRLQQEEDRLRSDGRCQSNDHHVLSLAIVTGARTLASFDNDLARDFRNAELIRGPRGSIYRDPAAHAHLLRHTPASCGVRATDTRHRRQAR